jgi:hypothetical protein
MCVGKELGCCGKSWSSVVVAVEDLRGGRAWGGEARRHRQCLSSEQCTADSASASASASAWESRRLEEFICFLLP